MNVEFFLYRKAKRILGIPEHPESHEKTVACLIIQQLSKVCQTHLDSTGKQVSVVGKTSGEWGSVKEGEGLLVLVEFLGALELLGYPKVIKVRVSHMDRTEVAQAICKSYRS